jgi:type I restriction enzyme S subunit
MAGYRKLPSVPLGQVAEIIMGQSPPGSTYNKIGDGLPFYQGIVDFGIRYPSRRVYCTAPTRIAEKGDILISVRAPIGRVNRAFEKCAIGRGLAVIRAQEHPDTTYIELFLRAASHLWDTLESQGSVFGNAKRDDLERLEIVWPQESIRHSIAHILGTLDDKIEVNRRMNETLEAIARTIFKSWFVDFDPVIDNALAVGNPIPSALAEKAARRRQALTRAKTDGRNSGLPKHIANLFPDRFEDYELGEIPAGWRVGQLVEEFILTMGQSPPGNSYNEHGEGMPFYQGRTDFTFRFPARRVYCTAPTRFAKAGDTLVSVRAPVGDVNMAAEDCAIGRGVAAVRHKSGSRSYTYQFMRSLKDIFARFEAEGTVFGCIGKKDFHAILCVLPPYSVEDAFEHVTSPLDERIEINERESCILVALRDMLLPKLMSGELRVSKEGAERYGNER